MVALAAPLELKKVTPPLSAAIWALPASRDWRNWTVRAFVTGIRDLSAELLYWKNAKPVLPLIVRVADPPRLEPTKDVWPPSLVTMAAAPAVVVSLNVRVPPLSTVKVAVPALVVPKSCVWPPLLVTTLVSPVVLALVRL